MSPEGPGGATGSRPSRRRQEVRSKQEPAKGVQAMIRVTVEVLPHGNEAGAREIARMDLGNVRDRAAASDYEISATSEADRRSGRPAFVASGMVVSHKRQDSIMGAGGEVGRLGGGLRGEVNGAWS